MRWIQHTNPGWTFLRKLQRGWTSARAEEGLRKSQIQGGPCSRTWGPRTTVQGMSGDRRGPRCGEWNFVREVSVVWGAAKGRVTETR